MSVIKFRCPARKWEEALPLGNGKIAVMAYGGADCERFDFNDATLWSGYPKNHDNPIGREYLSEARNLIFKGEYAAADRIVREKMNGNYSEAFMPLGSLFFKIDGETGGRYRRSLDLTKGLHTVESGEIRRTAFVSRQYDAAVLSLRSREKFSVEIYGKTALKGKTGRRGNTYVLYGNAPDVALPDYLRTKLFPIKYNEKKAMAYCLAVKAESDGVVECTDRGVFLRGATRADVFMRTKTGFKNYSAMPENDADVLKDVCSAELAFEKLSAEELLKEHIEAFERASERQSLKIARVTDDARDLYLKAKKGEADSQIAQLLYEYGKYMMISGSGDGEPLNLQGQWNKSKRPPWSGNLTTNINFEMNYWAVGACNVLESLTAFEKAVTQIAERGEKTAATNFGMRGFCCNHNVDIWRNTSPVKGDPQYMYSPLCGAWLACELYRHGKTLGRRLGVETITKAAEFCLDYLVEKDGALTVCPSVSPETLFRCKNGKSAVGFGSAFELEIVRQTFRYCTECCEDEALKNRAAEALKRLARPDRSEIGIAEWCGANDSIEEGHRHFSPLWGVYPGETITRGGDDFRAAEKLFEFRMNHSSPGIGWSAAWAMCLAGRFGNKNLADKAFHGFTSKSLLPNLFGFHPPRYFQIDGNLGFVAAVNEMLVTKDDGVLTLLPAAIEPLKTGKMTDLMVDGVKVSFEWKDGRVTSISAQKPVKVRATNLADDVLLENAEIVG